MKSLSLLVAPQDKTLFFLST